VAEHEEQPRVRAQRRHRGEEQRDRCGRRCAGRRREERGRGEAHPAEEARWRRRAVGSGRCGGGGEVQETEDDQMHLPRPLLEPVE
jgi:hypothetical protein